MRLIAGALDLSDSSAPRNSHRLILHSDETAPEGRTPQPTPPRHNPRFSTSWSEVNQGRAPTLAHDGPATCSRGHTPWRCDIHRRPSFTINTFVGGRVCRYQLLSELIKVIYTTRDQKVNAWALRVHTRLTDRFLAIITPMPLLQHQRSGEGDTLFNGTDRQVRGGPEWVRPSPGDADAAGRSRGPSTQTSSSEGTADRRVRVYSS